MKSSKSTRLNKLHWGELVPRDTHKQEIITPDIIDNVWRQVLDESNNSECDYMDYEHERQPKYIQLPVGDSHVLNTINFHRQVAEMESGVSIKNLTTIDTAQSSHIYESTNLVQFMMPQSNTNGMKSPSEKVKLQPLAAHNILKHAVEVLLVHIGFEKSSDIAIETITDIVQLFLRRMTLLLKLASEEKNDAFPDAVERVLLETGVGGIIEIHNYYQEYILKYEQKVKRKTEKILEEQKQIELNASNVKMEIDEIANKFSFEDLDAFGNVYREVPTLQLSDPDVDFPPSLDAGFQMLHSLEQDELNSLEVEEDQPQPNNSPSVVQQRVDHSTDKKKN